MEDDLVDKRRKKQAQWELDKAIWAKDAGAENYSRQDYKPTLWDGKGDK